MRASVVGVFLLLWAWPVWAQTGGPIETCLRMEWEYTFDARLGAFYLYVRPEHGRYHFYVRDGALPMASVPAIPEMLTSIPCSQIVLTQPGRYFVVVTAISLDLTDESPPSNEVELTYGALTPLPPPITTPPPDPWTLPPPPPPLGPVVILPPPPPPAQGDGTLTSTCVWQGCNATPAPPGTMPAPLTEAPAWQGE